MPTASTYRTIYQQSNLFVYPSGLAGVTATGQAFSSGNSGVSNVAELGRVQSIDLSSSINRTPINQFGMLGAIDQEIISPPTFNLNFSYFLTDGLNERILGFAAKGGGSFLSGIMTKVSESKNYLISYSPPGVDDDGLNNIYQRDVAALGNGFISNYSINASVNQPVTASVSVEGLNIASFTGASGNSPAVDPITARRITAWNWALPAGNAQTGDATISIIKPGDITFNMPEAAGFMSAVSGAFGGPINSFSLSIPMGRERIQALGAPFGISNELSVPIAAQVSINGLQTNLRPDSFDQLLCNDRPYSFSVNMRKPSCNGTGETAMVITINNAYLTSHSISQSLGGNATLSLSYASQIYGPTASEGVQISGYNG